MAIITTETTLTLIVNENEFFMMVEGVKRLYPGSDLAVELNRKLTELPE